MKIREIAILLAVLVLAAVLIAACAPSNSWNAAQEMYKQAKGVQAIIQNQPVLDLGGYSWDRSILNQLAAWRNKPTPTWTYIIEYGIVIEVCPSLGFPIPYGTQLTAPDYNDEPQPEPDSLYRPDNAEATYVMCVEPDGSLVPTYHEPRMSTMPYKVKADKVLERETEPTVKITP